MSTKTNLFTKALDPFGFFRKGSKLREAIGGGDKGSSSSGDVSSPVVSNTSAAATTEEEKKKRIGRAALYATSPLGDLSSASTASGRTLGN